MIDKINLLEKFSKFEVQWTPKIVGELNGQYVKLAKLQGDFVWHNHEFEDELFMVIKGRLKIEFRDHTVHCEPGELIIVPKGVDHKPQTGAEEVWVMLFEPKEIKHTGAVEDARTVKYLDWI